MTKKLFTTFFIIGSLFFSATAISQQSDTWQQTLSEKQGTIVVHWHLFKPFVYQNTQGKLTGIEYDLMVDFTGFVNSHYGVDLELDWTEEALFYNVYDKIKQADSPNQIGIGGASILDKRKEDIQFSIPYMKDITVLISHSRTSQINSPEDLIGTLNRMTAITSRNTTLEDDLNYLRSSNGMSFEMEYIQKDDEILEIIAANPQQFGYIELPNYLMAINNGLSVRRHNIAPRIKQGLALILPKNSDWIIPLNEYFNSEDFDKDLDLIMAKHLGYDVLNLINQITADDSITLNNEVTILNKEKEIQERELNKIKLKSQRDFFIRNLLLVGIVFVIIVAGILLYAYNQKNATNKLLTKQRKQIEQQQQAITKQNKNLKSSNKRLEKLDRQKSDLISILSHDLRVPVNQIKGFAQLMRLESDKANTEHKELIDKIILTSDRLGNMISKILDAESITSKKVILEMTTIDYRKLTTEVTQSFTSLAKEKQITIHTDIPNEAVLVNADYTYLTQVLENLISNAIKFSDRDSGIHIKLHTQSNKAIFSVKDNGPGLSSKDKLSLFKKYSKLSAKPTAGEQSTGLGLSIVKKYVKQMKGKVWAESKKGEGSTFFVELRTT